MPLPSISSMLSNITPSYFKATPDKEILNSIESPDDFIRNRTQILNMNQNIKSRKGYTPLYLAAMYHSESVKTLLHAGANPNVQTNTGSTPLHSAASYHPESVGKLLQAGANPNTQQSTGWTPLHSAACFHPKSVGELLKAGANPNIQDNDGWAPLHFAARNHPESVRQLLHAGANPNIQNKNGSTPLHLAALSDAPKEVIEELIAYGAKTDLWKKDGKTFLENAKILASYNDLKEISLPKMHEGIFFLRNEKGLVEEDLNLIHEHSTCNLFRNEGMIRLAAKSIIVFGATPFFVVGAMLQSLIRTVSDIASLFFNGRTIFKAEGTLALVKSIVLGIPKAIRDRVWEAVKMPLHGLKTMGYALYGLYNGNEARNRMNQAWGEGYLLKLSGMAPFGNLRDTVEGKMKFYTKELKN